MISRVLRRTTIHAKTRRGQSIEMVATLVSKSSRKGVELFSFVNTFFCSNKFAWLEAT